MKKFTCYNEQCSLWEVELINTIITSKEAILETCKKLVSENGLHFLNMRTVSEKCNISVGSVYNYFPSKTDLIVDTIKEVWQSIFQTDKLSYQTESFPDFVALIFQNFQKGAAEYPNFFTAHSMSFAASDKDKARMVMDYYFGHFKAKMLDALDNDTKIKSTCFSKDFSKKGFVNFVFSNLLMLIINQEDSCAQLIEIVKRTIY